MNIKGSKRNGYCRGVSRVVKLAEKVLQQAKAEGKPAYCLGSLVHNERIKAHFGEAGLKYISCGPEGLEPGLLLVSAHGAPESLVREFAEAGFEVYDGTCNNIVTNKHLIQKRAAMGYFTVIIGIHGHSESTCLQGVELFPGVRVASALVSCEADLELIPEGFPIFVISQTTAKKEVFERLVARIRERFPDAVVQNSLCASPLSRQQQVLELCKTCQAVVVIGGRKSANTAALAVLAEQHGVKAFRIEPPEHVPPEVFNYETVGVCSGSSTPEDEVKEILKEFENHV